MYVIGPTPPELFASQNFFQAVRRALRDGGADSQAGGAQVTKRATLMGLLGGAEFDGTPDAGQHVFEEEEEDMWSALAEAPPLERAKALAVHDGKWVGRIIALHRLSKQHHRCGDPTCGTSPGGVVITVEEQLRLYCGVNIPASSSSSQSSPSTTTQSPPSLTYMPFGLGNGHVPPCTQAPMQPQPSSLRPKLTRGQNGVMQQHSPCPADFGFSFMPWSDLKVRSAKTPSPLDFLSGSGHSLMLCNNVEEVSSAPYPSQADNERMRWLLDQVLVSDTSEPCDTLLFSTEALSDVGKLRSVVEGLLEQIWVMCMRRAPEGVIDQITSHAGAHAMLPGYHALPFMDQRVCVISVAAIIARAVLVAVRQWRKRTLADADPKARTCGCPLRSSAPIPDVLRYVRLCSRPTSLSTVPSSRTNGMTPAATAAGGTLRSLELGSQGLGQLWRSMTVKERHDLLNKLMLEASQAPVEAAPPQHTHISSSLSLSSSSSTMSVRSNASHDSPSPTGPSQKKHKSKCSISSSTSTTNSSPRRSPPERPVITPAAQDMVCDSLTSSPGLADSLATVPLGEPITVEVLCGIDILGEVMLEALCMTPLSSSLDQHRVRMAGRVKRALEEFWADMHARRLLEEEQTSSSISNGQGKESKDGSVALGSGGAGGASRKPKKKNKKKAKTSTSPPSARPMDASPSSPTPKPSSRSTTKQSSGTTPTTTKHTTTIATTSTPRKTSDKPTPSASSSPPSNPPSSAAASTSPQRSEASASSSSSPVVIPAPARGMSPPTRETLASSTTSPRRKQAASAAPSASSSSSCSMTPQQTAPSCRSTATTPLVAPRAVLTETPCTQTDLGPDKADAGTSSTAHSSSTRRGRVCSSPPQSSPPRGSAPATTATKKLTPPSSPQKTPSKDKMSVDGSVAALPRKKLEATSAPATTPSGSGELTLSPTAEPYPSPSTSKKATEAVAVTGSSSPQRPKGLCKKLHGTPHRTMSPPTRASSAPLPSQQQQHSSSSSAARSINGAPMGPYTPVSVEEVAGPLDLIGWDTSRRIRERLSEEIEEMAHGLVDVAMKRRPWQLHALTQLEQSLSRLWPSARMEVYGSFTTGLSMPASDVDVVISNLPEPTVPWVPHRGNGSAGPQQLLTALADHLKTQEWITSMQCITHTAVPLIKLTTAGGPTRFADTRGVIKIDISLDWGGTHRGVQSSHLVQRLCHVYRQLPPLVVVLKQLLLQRGLSDTYTGGLSSYALTIMVASVLQRHILEPPDVQPDVGTMFMAFLQTFGTRFDTRRYGVWLSPTGPLFPLSTWSPHLPRVGTPEYWQPADPVVIQDPLQPANNVGRACFGFRQVQVALDQCLTRILHYGERLVSATSSSSSSRKHTPSLLNNVLGTCASPPPLALDPPATRPDASGDTRTGSERRTASLCAHTEGQGAKRGKVVMEEEREQEEAHDKDEQGDDNEAAQAEDKDVLRDGEKVSHNTGNARSVETPTASESGSQRTASTKEMSQDSGDQSPVTTASAVSTPDPVLAPEDCSILGLAVFSAPHHRHVVELTAQVWCPPDMPPPPPTAANHISTCESRMYSRPVMQTVVTSEDAGRGRGRGGASRPAYLRQVPYVPTPPGGQQQQAHVVAQPHHPHHPPRHSPHHHHSVSPYRNGGVTYAGRGSGANAVVRRDGFDRGQPRWRTHGNFDGAQPPPPPPTSSSTLKPRLHPPATAAMGVPKAMGLMKTSSHGLRVPPSAGGAVVTTSADKAVQTMSGSRHNDTPLMAEAR